MSSRRLFVGAGVALLLVASNALAFAPDQTSQSMEIPLPEYMLVQRPSPAFAAERTGPLAERYGGNWHIGQWNQFSGTPQSIYGSGVELSPSGLTTDAVAETVAREFIASNADILGARVDDLALDQVVRAGNKVAVHFDQLHHGVPVMFSDVHTVSLDTGRLYYMTSEFFGDIDVSPVPMIGATQAQSIAEQAVGFDMITDSPDGDPVLKVLPIPMAEGGSEYHLVWEVRSLITDPYAIWMSYVDAHSGEIVHRYNDVHSIYSGTMQGEVDNFSYCISIDTLPFRDMDLTVSGSGSTTTGADGSWTINSSNGNQTLSAAMDGPTTRINNSGGAEASISEPISDGVPLTFDWNDGNSHPAERSAFYWINETMAWVKGLDATYNHCKYTSNVNVGSTCNANWGGCVMNFFSEGGGCGNTGRIGDVMAHEFGHGVQDDLIGSQGGQGLGEGNGDCLGQFLTGDSIIGRGFFLDDCSRGIRDCNNNLQYPDDVIGQPIHSAGRVMCGATWDMRNELEVVYGAEGGRQTAGEIWYWSRKLDQPTTQPAQILAYFVYDDDDGNLDNGTPNYDAICTGATNHGFECPEILEGVIIAHTPLGSTTDHVNPFTVSANIFSTTGTVVTTSMFYRIDGGLFTEVAMGDDGGDNYSADIPAQAMDAVIDYYIFAEDNIGNSRTSPSNAPTATHSFSVATIIDELEVASGWTPGIAGDDATTGVWVRVDPIPTAAQPGNDHTPDPGVLCFVTGQGSVGGSIGENDVDNGSTTLLSPVYDLSGATASARIQYWRWYSNNGGADPNNDFWVVDVSNDGGSSWTNVENINPPNGDQNTWLQVEVDLFALFGSADQVQLRFIASDLNSGSIVEAAVDDLVVLTQAGSTGIPVVGSPDAAVKFTVHAARPNPFNPATTLAYDVPVDGQVRMEIYDTAGRVIRTLVDGFVEAGSHSMSWDGRSDLGTPVSSGVYHLRVSTASGVQTQKLTLLK